MACHEHAEWPAEQVKSGQWEEKMQIKESNEFQKNALE
jgi:hypothetical protein